MSNSAYLVLGYAVAVVVLGGFLALSLRRLWRP